MYLSANHVCDLVVSHYAYIHRPEFCDLLLHNIQEEEPSFCDEFLITGIPVKVTEM